MRLIFALCLLGTAAGAGETAACLGWSVDRATLAIVVQKHKELRSTLAEIPPDDPRYRLSDTLVERLGLLTEALEAATLASGRIFETACASFLE